MKNEIERIHFNIIKIMMIEMKNETELIRFNIIKIMMIIHFEKKEEIIIAEKVILTDESI